MCFCNGKMVLQLYMCMYIFLVELLSMTLLLAL